MNQASAADQFTLTDATTVGDQLIVASSAAGSALARRIGKRLFDIAIAGVLLLLTLPVTLVVVLLIRLESRGPAFYRARRAGYRGRPLDVLKFRKMHATAAGGPLTAADDERFTRIGAILARTKLDELPQLINVLLGQMSIVGPRPEDLRFVELHHEAYAEILEVRPGMTGWSQLAFAQESRILDPADPISHYVRAILPQKVKLDASYARRGRLVTDLKILLWTAATLGFGVQVAVDRRTGACRVRRRELRQLQPAAAPGSAEMAS